MIRFFTLAILCFCVLTLNAQSIGDYQTVTSGNWSALTTWNTWNGSAWVAPAAVPNSTNGIITIQSGHTVTLNVGAISIDDVIVNGTLQTGTTAAAGSFTIANGTPGADLVINGTFIDNLTTGVITWAASATWQFGTNGTLVKTSGSSSNNWQSNYNGGAASMPATANWIIRKVNAQQPAVSSTTPASGSVYPNLIIENNNAAAWTAPAGSGFSGSTAAPIIKGNLDVGGSGTNTVDFLNTNSFTNPVIVYGNILVRSGCNIRNYGTGFETQGNLTVNGSITYDANDARRIVFSGSANQTINGTGLLNVYDLVVSKTAGSLTLNRAVTVDNQMTFTSGIVYTTSTNLLSIASTGSVTGASNASFVSGPVRYYGTSAFTFPVGKNSDYQALGIGGYTPTGGAFWTETFSNACANGCFLPYTGPNGSWVSTATGTNAANSNKFYVSGAECGNAAGACGTGCGATDPSLHVGPNDGIVSNDGGARYDAGGLCGFLACVSADMRAESPTINCTGHTTIFVSFNYIENGQGTFDNATLWYFDGATWSLLVDMPKTPSTCSPQGTWTAYSFPLPASADNNPNVKIGFRWVNNDDGAGSDPSFAVDDVSLGTAPESFTAEYFYANPQLIYNNVLAPTLSSISACEYWILDRLPSNSTASTSVTLTWDGNSCPAIPQLNDTRVAHFDLTMWQDEGNGGTTGTTAAGTVSSAAPVTYFSPFTIGLIPPTPLPVEMLRFEGYCLGASISLNWSTASEQNNDYFGIERSTDGVSFSTIGTRDGAGNSDMILHYSFTDAQAAPGMNYYRIKQTDFNGRFSYSKIIAVDKAGCSTNNSLTLSNAWFTENTLEIDYFAAAAPVSIEIYAADGRLLQQLSGLPPQANYSIQSGNWSSSVYFIRISDGITSVSRTIAK